MLLPHWLLPGSSLCCRQHYDAAENFLNLFYTQEWPLEINKIGKILKDLKKLATNSKQNNQHQADNLSKTNKISKIIPA